MAKSAKNGGCGECQTSCQSACKTSCGIANQACENKEAGWDAMQLLTVFQEGVVLQSPPNIYIWDVLRKNKKIYKKSWHKQNNGI